MHESASADDQEVELRRIIEENARKERRCVRALVVLLTFEAVVFWEYAGNKPWHETLAFILCDLGIAAAVGGELIFEARRSAAQSESQRISDERVAASIAQATVAEKRAAEANQKAEEARLELAKYRAFRELDPEQIERVADKLRPFCPVEYDVNIASRDSEVMYLLILIVHTLGKAGWTLIDWAGTGLQCASPRGSFACS